MNTKLITALRMTAKALESETFDYNWGVRAHCNCGSLFCSLTGKSAAELDKVDPWSKREGKADWKKVVGRFCPVSGMPSDELFKELFSYGLTAQDIVNLEYLSDKMVLAELNATKQVSVETTITLPKKWYHLRTPTRTEHRVITTKRALDHQYKSDVIAYMRAWADLLTKDGQLDSPQLQDELEKQGNP